MARIFLVDTSFLLHRAYHALPPLQQFGRPVHAVRGLLSTLGKLWRSESIRHLACVFEGAGPALREGWDPAYKAHRKATPDDLKVQLPVAREACAALGLACYGADGYEADDVLATLARRASEAGHSCVLVSNDKDLAQACVHPQVELLRLKAGAALDYVDASRVPELYGVEPSLIASWLALNGDASDNIPGVPGIGPKVACRLLRELGPLPGLLDRAGEAGRYGAVLLSHRERLLLNLRLATLKDDVPLEFSLESVTPGDCRNLPELFGQLGMKRELEALGGLFGAPRNVSALWG